MEGATDFGVAWGEASGDEEGGVGGAGGAGGEEWAWGGGSELAEEGEGFFWGGGVGDEERRDGGGGSSYILGNVGLWGGGEGEGGDGEGGGGGGGREGESEKAEGLHGFGQLAGAGYANGDLSHGMKDSLFLGISSTGSALIAAESEIKKEGGEEGGGEAGSEKEKNRSNFHTTKEDGGGNIRDKEQGDSESKDDAKPTAGGFAGKAGDLKDAVVAEKDRFGLDDPEGERNKSEKEGVVDKKTCENEKQVSKSGREGGGNGEGVESGENDDEGDARVGEWADFETGGADEELRWGGFKKKEIESASANEVGQFNETGHKKSGEDLLDELVGGDEDDHLVTVPARDTIDVLINDADKGELENEPSEFNDDPGEKISAEGEFAGDGVANLDEPELEEMNKIQHRFIHPPQCICVGQLSKGGGREREKRWPKRTACRFRFAILGGRGFRKGRRRGTSTRRQRVKGARR